MASLARVGIPLREVPLGFVGCPLEIAGQFVSALECTARRLPVGRGFLAEIAAEGSGAG